MIDYECWVIHVNEARSIYAAPVKSMQSLELANWVHEIVSSSSHLCRPKIIWLRNVRVGKFGISM